MRTPPLLPLAISLLVFTAASCGDDDSATAEVADVTTMEPVTTGASGMPATPVEAAAVAIADFSFGPAAVTIVAGGTVTWTNTDGQAHTATSSGNFDTGAIDPGSSATVTFDEPGTYTYICSFHPFMTGTVTVV